MYSIPECNAADWKDSLVLVDASKKSVAQARENAALSGMGDRPIRWLTDDAAKFTANTSVDVTNRLSIFMKFAYESRDYASRPLLDDASQFQKDDIYTAITGLFWRFNGFVSLGVVYSYRQKNSNEPSQTYSESISTVGLYYTF